MFQEATRRRPSATYLYGAHPDGFSPLQKSVLPDIFPAGTRKARGDGDGFSRLKKLTENMICYAASTFLLSVWLKSARVPDKKVIETDQDGLTLSLKNPDARSSCRKSSSSNITFSEGGNLRQRKYCGCFRKSKSLKKNWSQASYGETLVWSLGTIITLLTDSFFRSEDIEKILSSPTPPAGPA